MAVLNFSNITPATTLAGDITDVATTLDVTSAIGYPEVPFKIRINAEVVRVDAKSGTTFSSLQRGWEDTTKVAHSEFDQVEHVVTAADIMPRLDGTTYTMESNLSFGGNDITEVTDITLAGNIGFAGPGSNIGDGIDSVSSLYLATLRDPDGTIRWDMTGSMSVAGAAIIELGLGLGAAGDAQLYFLEGADDWYIQTGSNADVYTTRMRFNTADHTDPDNIIFYAADGTTESLKWFHDPVGGNWQVFGDNEAFSIHGRGGTGAVYMAYYRDTGTFRTGEVGHVSGTDAFYINARYGDLRLRATRVTADTNNISLWTDDVGGSLTQRMFFAGDGAISMYDNTGDLRFEITSDDIIFYDDDGTTPILTWAASKFEFSTPVDFLSTTRFEGDLNIDNNEIDNVNTIRGDTSSDLTIRMGGGSVGINLADSVANTRIAIVGGNFGDLIFYNLAGASETLRWDNSDGRWEFKDELDLEGGLYLATRGGIQMLEQRGTNLWYNGSGLLGDNTNFSSFTYDGLYAFVGAGGFFSSAFTSSFFSPVRVAIDRTKPYATNGFVIQPTNTGQRQYLALRQYDADGLSISPIMGNPALFEPGSETTVAVAWTKGDPTITVDDASGWNDSLSFRSINLYPYTNSHGFVYPDYEYTRVADVQDFTIVGDVITLANDSPAEFPASLSVGDKIGQSRSGGSFIYPWSEILGTEGEWHAVGGVTSASSWWWGASEIALGFLINYTIAGGSVAWSGLRFEIDYAVAP